MGAPKLGDLAVRVRVIGHASPRWKSAKDPAEADCLNLQLSAQRAGNVRQAVADILKHELPGLPIQVPANGVGSHERFPTASEDNAAVDRSVLVMIELTTTRADAQIRANPPQRVYVPSKVWSLKVLTMLHSLAALGYVEIFLRVAIRNPYSGKEMILSGILRGGGASTSIKDSLKIGKSLPPLKPIGREVAFSTDEALDFDDFARGAHDARVDSNAGLPVRLGRIDISFGLKTTGAYLVLRSFNTDPDMLFFDTVSLGFGFISADSYVVSGRLYREGPNPGDWLELPTPSDIVPVTSQSNQGVLLTFPTGKFGLDDLTPKDRKDLGDFVTNKARAIAALSESFKTSASHP